MVQIISDARCQMADLEMPHAQMQQKGLFISCGSKSCQPVQHGAVLAILGVWRPVQGGQPELKKDLAIFRPSGARKGQKQGE